MLQVMNEIKAVQLSPQTGRNIDFTKCIICHKNNKTEKKLASTPKGRQKIIDASEQFGDSFMSNFSPVELNEIKYHVNSCYALYIKRADRLPLPSEEDFQDKDGISIDVISPRTRSQSGASTTPQASDEIPCIICNIVKKKGVTTRYRIGQKSCAWHFLAAINFNKDDVYRRCIFCTTPGDIFATDIFYHDNCLKGYLAQFDRDLKKVNDYNVNASDGDTGCEISNAVDELRSGLVLDSRGYVLTECHNKLNEKLLKTGVYIFVSNRRLKKSPH